MVFLLKRERRVVEAKMTRKSLGQEGVANHLAVDTDRCRVHPDGGTLSCFAYGLEAGHCAARRAGVVFALRGL
jgi:hypothetical protein